MEKIICNKHTQPLLLEPASKKEQFLQICSLCLSSQKRELYCEEMDQLIIALVNQMKELQNDIQMLENDQIDYCIQLNDGVILEGPIVNGIKHGEYFYSFDDGTKIYAGLYQNNLKEGIWNDFFSFNYELDQLNVCTSSLIKQFKQKKKRVAPFKYKEGNKIISSKIVKNVGQQNIFIEKIGTFNQLDFRGELINNIKIGACNYYKEYLSGGGNFDEKGQKVGQWQELFEKFNDEQKIIYTGEYKDNIRIGSWKYSYFSKEFGGGIYDENGVKSGRWIEFHDNYQFGCRITYEGEYKNGLRTGKWKYSHYSQEIGGGIYDEKGLKKGQWIDLSNNYIKELGCQSLDTGLQVTYQGEYKNGLRTGKWKTLDLGKEIGGGIYNQNGLKQDNWIDLHDNYNSNSFQVTYQGEYENGFRKGKWKTLDKGYEVGGGIYDEKGKKSGLWVDIDDDIYNQKESTQCDFRGFRRTQQGKYKNGIKTGEWKTLENEKEICKGIYDEKGLKTGIWIYLHASKNSLIKMTCQEEYKDGFLVDNCKETNSNYTDSLNIY